METRKKAGQDARVENGRRFSNDAFDFDMNSDATWEEDILGRFESERWHPLRKRARRDSRGPKGNRDDEYFEDTYFERGA